MNSATQLHPGERRALIKLLAADRSLSFPMAATALSPESLPPINNQPPIPFTTAVVGRTAAKFSILVLHCAAQASCNRDCGEPTHSASIPGKRTLQPEPKLSERRICTYASTDVVRPQGLTLKRFLRLMHCQVHPAVLPEATIY
jgi:hypothetical protein